jgi:hypothetical protein
MTGKSSNSLPLPPQTLPTNKIRFDISPIFHISVKAGSLNYVLVFVQFIKISLHLAHCPAFAYSVMSGWSLNMNII